MEKRVLRAYVTDCKSLIYARFDSFSDMEGKGFQMGSQEILFFCSLYLIIIIAIQLDSREVLLSKRATEKKLAQSAHVVARSRAKRGNFFE